MSAETEALMFAVSDKLLARRVNEAIESIAEAGSWCGVYQVSTLVHLLHISDTLTSSWDSSWHKQEDVMLRSRVLAPFAQVHQAK